MKIPNPCVDIIIPVYNAYEDLKKCVQSIKACTDFKRHTLILIDDKSTDTRIQPFLDGLASDKIKVIHNKENMGFSGNINIGMHHSDQDVILLNSDTIVTNGWIEKMVACAYSDKSIATVTPLSNNATLCSVPEFCKENEIPEDITIEEINELIERCSFKEYPTIPVAHGFCMFIKRSVIEEIGDFDAETFGRGYGEENDFCYRAIQAGYRNAMCDDTFIYHKGTSSFMSDEKLFYIAEHEKILKQRYPKEMRDTQIHCSINPNRQIQERIKKFLYLRKNKENILYLLQSDFREDALDNCGGTQLHVKDMTDRMRKNYNVFVLARDGEYLNLTVYTEKEQISYRYFIGTKGEYPVFSNIVLKKLFGDILDVFQIQLVHIHHVYGLSLDLYEEAEKREIPIFTTLHDYYVVCPNVKLLDSRDKLCIGKETKAGCEMCLAKNWEISSKVNYLSLWREKMRTIFEKSSLLIVPSQSAKMIILRYFPEYAEKIQVIPHGSDAFETVFIKSMEAIISDDIKTYADEIRIKEDGSIYFRGWAYEAGEDMAYCHIFVELTEASRKRSFYRTQSVIREDVAQGDRKKRYSGISCMIPSAEIGCERLEIRILIQNKMGEIKTNGNVYHLIKETSIEIKKKFHIAFIGGLSVAKGAKIAYDLIKKSSSDINWFIFGDIGYGKLASLEQKNLIKTGPFVREELQSLVVGNQIDLICILPIWPETFCYTLSEALLCHVPVLTTELGALKERMEELRCGWMVPAHANERQIWDKIQEIYTNSSEYEKIKAHIETLKLRDVQSMVDDYKELYREYRKEKIFLCASIEQKRAILLSENRNTIKTDMGNTKLNQRLQQVENRLMSIENSMTYQIALKLASIRLPFKQQIRKLVYKKH